MRRVDCSEHAGRACCRGDPAGPVGRVRGPGGQRVAVALQHGDLHVCLLLPKADALHHLPAVRWDLRSLLLQADALHHLSAVRRHLRALLLQADAVSV